MNHYSCVSKVYIATYSPFLNHSIHKDPAAAVTVLKDKCTNI